MPYGACPSNLCTAHNADGYVKSYTIGELTTANPKIKPERPDSYTAGIVLSPLTLAHELPNAYDTDAFYAPFAAFLHDRLSHGDIPLWNPYAFSGQPFAADPQSGALYPPALLFYGLFAPATGMVLIVSFHYLLATLSSYAFARLSGAGRLGAIYAGLAFGVSGYLLARYGFDLGLTRSRTVATGIVVVCGLAVVMRLETGGGRRRLALAGLCALMLLVFALAFIIPFLRNFYELSTPDGDVFAAWALGTVVGIGGMLGALRLLRV